MILIKIFSCSRCNRWIENDRPRYSVSKMMLYTLGSSLALVDKMNYLGVDLILSISKEHLLKYEVNEIAPHFSVILLL